MLGAVMKLHDMPAVERPRERLLAVGAERMAQRELLAIVLRTGIRGANALDLADSLLAES
jgi:DNA repair protein RadC